MKYVRRRLAHALALTLAISFFSFLLANAAPGDFFDTLRLNPQMSSQMIERLRSEHGLRQPFLIRYLHWLASMARGQMGISLAYNTPIGPLIAGRICSTLLLTSCSLTLSWLLALPAGIWTAWRQGKWADSAAELVVSSILTVPELLLFLALLFLAARTGQFPAGGMLSLSANRLGSLNRLLDLTHHLILPVVGLTLVSVPVVFRHVHAAFIEILRAPFIRTARSHGVSEMRLLLRYALPAAANPLISLLGLSIGSMLSVSLLAEVIFSWPGIGPFLLDAIMARDTQVVIAVVLVSSTFVIVGNLFADLLLFVTDPRIRLE